MTEFPQKNGPESEFTHTIGSLASAAANITAQADLADSAGNFGVRGFLTVQFKTGADAPTAGKVVSFYLARGGRSDGSVVDDDLGVLDTAVTVTDNLLDIGSIVVTATSGKVYKKTFYIPGGVTRYASIVVWNEMDKALSTANGDHLLHWIPIFDEVS